jgi:hypothetical protein
MQTSRVYCRAFSYTIFDEVSHHKTLRVEAGSSSFTALTQMSIHKIDHTFVPWTDALEELMAKGLNVRMS